MENKDYPFVISFNTSKSFATAERLMIVNNFNRYLGTDFEFEEIYECLKENFPEKFI